MDSNGAMNSLRDDTIKSVRNGKNASAQRGDDQDYEKGAFDSVLASLATPMLAPSAPIPATIQQDVSSAPNAVASQAVPPSPQQAPGDSTTSLNQATLPSPQQTAGNSPIIANQATATTSLTTGGAPAVANAAVVQGQNDGQAFLTQLGLVDADGQSSPLTATATPAEPSLSGQATAPSVTTNAAMLSASRSNAGVNSQLQSSGGADAPSSQAPQASTTPPAPSQGLASNDNGAHINPNKIKPAATETSSQAPTSLLEPVSTTTDGAGSTSIISGQEVAAPANDQANRATQLTPHTIPMLAATMMRRFESGSRQFTMRLDPPELGQVEVKLTVAPDKKVRAVVSADRPEALADLVRSARELTRALAEAGLDLEENGLTFQMNDPSAGGQQHQAHDQKKQSSSHVGGVNATSTDTQSIAKTPILAPTTPSDPFERWQRARIALTV